MKTIQINNQEFKVVVTIKRRNKNVYLRVKEGIVYITSPVKLSDYSISDMINRNYQSICKLMNNKPKLEDEIHFLGKSYKLNIVKSTQNLVYLNEDKFIVEVVNPSNASVAKLTELFYRQALENIVRLYANDIQEKFKVNGKINYYYKNVKGYYGQCTPKRNKITLSTNLAKYDLKYIISVLYHEFAHFKYLNHQKEFYDYLENIYPNYRRVQRELRKIKYNDAF